MLEYLVNNLDLCNICQVRQDLYYASYPTYQKTPKFQILSYWNYQCVELALFEMKLNYPFIVTYSSQLKLLALQNLIVTLIYPLSYYVVIFWLFQVVLIKIDCQFCSPMYRDQLQGYQHTLNHSYCVQSSFYFVRLFPFKNSVPEVCCLLKLMQLHSKQVCYLFVIYHLSYFRAR